MHSLHVLKHSFSLTIQIVPTERNNQRIQTNSTVDQGAEADSIPLEETDINTATTNTQNTATSCNVDNANSTTTFANTDFSTVVENPSPEHPADGEEATQTTAHEVSQCLLVTFINFV